MIATVLAAILTIVCGPYIAALLAPEEAKTLPTPYYLTDDIQYFPAGPNQNLNQEAELLEDTRPKQTAGS